MEKEGLMNSYSIIENRDDQGVKELAISIRHA